MSIFNHFRHLNLSKSQEEAITMLKAFLDSTAEVFLLKGYAGSGKTTIIKGLVDYLCEINKQFEIMAPTGRAAKILREKTGKGKTIHSAIYNFDKLISINNESEDESTHSYHYYFPIDESNNENRILIIDESSMISAKESKNELFTFGTNILLEDLFTYAKIKSGNKLIFVGDPAQLPPVTDNNSYALDKDYLSNRGYSVIEIEMQDVLRQTNNLILENATRIRNLIFNSGINELNLKYDNDSFCRLQPSEIIEKYVEEFPNPEIGNGVIISFSNSQCYHYNLAIRNRIFSGNESLVSGDLLMVNNNNYHTYGCEIFNGDIVKVITVEPNLVFQSAPVFNKEANKRINIVLQFRKIKVRVANHSLDIDCFIIESLLHSIDRDLSIDEMKAQYINFVIRFNEKQMSNKEAGQPYYKVGSEEFKQELKTDPYYNALKVKFGYAITCHKSQGGEWGKVFVDYSGRISLKQHPLRWCYTATTRGINTVFALNAPNFGKLDYFNFTNVGKISRLPNEALNFNNITLSPFHKISQHRCKSAKYWEIVEKLEKTEFKIKNVETINEYLERYTISHFDNVILIQANHRISGHFVESFKIVGNSMGVDEIFVEELFNSKFNSFYEFNYEPRKHLVELHSWMQACCTELGIQITNVYHNVKQNYVCYYLITDSICSYIQFYYNNSEQLTSALPKTFNVIKDNMLESLIIKLQEYAN